jgi:hypothetical protein
MLPDLRAVIAATIATVGLLMIAFGAVAAFRVAQGSHGSLQAELAVRARMAELLPPPARRPVRVIDTPGPHIAPLRPLPVVEVRDAPIATEFRDLTPPAFAVAGITAPETAPEPAPPAPAAEATVLPPAEPPMGGPLAEAKPASEAERAAAKAERARKLAAAKRARAARLARQRKAAARRAAQARAKQQQLQQQQLQLQPQPQATTSFNLTFGNPNFNWGSGNQ